MALKNPSGDFVEETDYDPTAKTQKISTQDVENMQKNSRKKEDNKFVAFIKEHKVFSVFIGLILLFFIAFGGTMLVLKVTNPKEVEVPNVVGSTREEAQQKIEGAKLKFEVSSEEYSADTEENHVISQDPAYLESYNKVKEGSTVKVVISKGTEKTKVPNVKGKEKDEAVQLIEDAKLKAEIVEETSKTIESGYITKQETDEGTEVNAGDTVKVYISIGTGIKQVVVTSVLQKDVETAKKNLEEKGLVVEIEYTEDKTKDNGVVLNQSIKSGETVDEGSTITLTVNKIAETKTGTVTINVKSITGYQDKIKKPVTESVKGETTSTTIQKEVEVDNTPNTIQLKVTVDGETVTDEKVKENVTDKQVSVSGKGNVTIKVYIDGILKKTVDMNLNNTDKLTIE